MSLPRNVSINFSRRSYTEFTRELRVASFRFTSEYVQHGRADCEIIMQFSTNGVKITSRVTVVWSWNRFVNSLATATALLRFLLLSFPLSLSLSLSFFFYNGLRQLQQTSIQRLILISRTLLPCNVCTLSSESNRELGAILKRCARNFPFMRAHLDVTILLNRRLGDRESRHSKYCFL